jgi:hypothetical protein
MEEHEDPTEHVQETIHHHAEHAAEPWIMRVAVSTALYAALAAITSLLAGHDANHAMLEQMRASDGWAWYQAEGIKRAVLESKNEMLAATGHPAKPEDQEKVAKYEEKRKEIDRDARELQTSAKRRFNRHTNLARGVTFFQVAIAVAAIAVLAGRKEFWYGSVLLAAIGAAFVIYGFAAAPHLGAP